MAARRSCDRCRLRFQNRSASRLCPRRRYFRPLSNKGDTMNTPVNTKKGRRRFSANVLTLLVGVVALLVLGNPSVQAQTAVTTVDSSVTVATTGTVTEGTTTVNVNGKIGR